MMIKEKKDLFLSILMKQLMKVNGLEIIEMDMVNKFGLMDHSI